MANLDGPPYYDSVLGDVAVPAAVAPLGTPPFGSFPSMRTSCIIGSPKLVTTLVDRDAIPSTLRAEGMTCYVQATLLTYQLVGGILNANWVTASATSSSVQVVLPYFGIMAAGDAVRVNGAGQAIRANATLLTAIVVGLVLAVDSPVAGQVTVATSGQVPGLFGGLALGGQYILSTSPGLLVLVTDVANPFYPAPGDLIIPVAIATSAADVVVNVSAFVLSA